MLQLANILLLCLGLEVASSSNPIDVQDWLTLNKQVLIGDESETTCPYISDYFMIQHVASGKYIRPDEGSLGIIWPDDLGKVRIGGNESEAEENKFKFVQVIGHLGFIEHRSGRAVIPNADRNPNPDENTEIVVSGERHSGGYFAFDEENIFVVHSGGSILHAEGDDFDPEEGTDLIVNTDISDAARFMFVPDLYPTPAVSGRWIQILAVISPISDQSFNITFVVGKSLTKQVTEGVFWKTTSSIALPWFEANPELNRYVNMTETTTWEEEEERTYLVEITAGQTSVTWQYVFFADRFDEEYAFRSSLVEETDDPFIPPEI